MRRNAWYSDKIHKSGSYPDNMGIIFMEKMSTKPMEMILKSQVGPVTFCLFWENSAPLSPSWRKFRGLLGLRRPVEKSYEWFWWFMLKSSCDGSTHVLVRFHIHSHYILNMMMRLWLRVNQMLITWILPGEAVLWLVHFPPPLGGG